jgi:hypothetical protein
LEGDTAVIIAEEGCDTVEISKRLLPPNCREGDMLSFTIEIKDKKTNAEKEKVKRLIKKLSSDS